MDLIVELKKLQGKRLTTLYQNKPFEITQVSNNQIILKTSKESQRPIPLKEITSAWNHLEKHKKLTRSQVRDLGYSEFVKPRLCGSYPCKPARSKTQP